MDGNRTHPGRLSSAPQTVLKTAGWASLDIRRDALKDPNRWALVLRRALLCASVRELGCQLGCQKTLGALPPGPAKHYALRKPDAT